MVWTEEEPATVLAAISAATGEPVEVVQEFIGHARRAIDSLVVVGWALVMPPLVVAPHDHRPLDLLEARLADESIEVPDLDDWSALASYLELSTQELEDAPIGGVGVLAATMVDDFNFAEQDLARLEPILDAWLDTFQDAERSYAIDPKSRGLVRPQTVSSRAELIEVFREWLADEPQDQIGDSRGGLIRLDIGDVGLFVSGDTKRSAVRELVKDWDCEGASRSWHVLANRSGKCNKISFRDVAIPGWYCYLDEPWFAPGLL